MIHESPYAVECSVKRTRESLGEEETTLNAVPLLQRTPTIMNVSTVLRNVPPYLHSSEFFQLLTININDRDDFDTGEETNVVTIPIDCIKYSDSIESEGDLVCLLKSLQFWIATEVPSSLYEFAFSVSTCQLFFQVLTDSDFAKEMPFIADLLFVAKEPSIRAQFVCAIQRRVSEKLLSFMMHFYHSFQQQIETLLVQEACSMGVLYVLQFVHEQKGCRLIGHNCVYLAVRGGHVDCLRYAHEHGCESNKFTCRVAARHGHLECLRYAHEHHFQWDISVCEAAARQGQLECLKYSHDNGCPWGEIVCEQASKHGHLECL